ncbi:MAG: SpoIID/LytB domain-containing protein, partial [Candidatus Hydrothermia bacterium]
PMGPFIRVGIDERQSFELQASDSFWVMVGSQGVFKAWPGKWRVRAKGLKSARFCFWMMMWRGPDSSAAHDTVLSLIQKGYPRSVVMPMGKVFAFPQETIDMRDFAVLVGPYATESEAMKNAPKPRQAVIKLTENPAAGTLELVAPDGRVPVVAEGPLRITGYKPIGINGKLYPDILEFLPSTDGRGILLVNEVQMENYLVGVLPYEMGPGFPKEALKAQAVLARCHAFFVWGKKFKLTGEPYDLTDDVFTQVYNGIGEGWARVDSAVKETRGCVLLYEGRIIKAPFHASCGGFLETSQAVWGEDIPGTGARPDAPDSFELDIKKFIDNPPDVWCNPKTHDFPSGFKYGKAYFRWEKSKTGAEWGSTIAKNTGNDPGNITSMEVKDRGPGGRVTRLVVTGTKKTLTLEGEYNIRQALGLESALFYLEKEGKKLTIRGGGFGHGSGMCQIGAGVMANEGKNYMEILLHYFRGVVIREVY